jgi:integrase
MPKKAKARRDGIYTRKDRPGYWGSWTDAQGRRVQRKLNAHTMEQARIMLKVETDRVAEEIRFGRPRPTEESFNAFADEFLKYQKRRISPKVVKGKLSQAEYNRQQGIIENHLKPFFGSMKLASIRRKDVNAYIHSRLGEVSDGTIIKEVNTLKRLFSVAIDLEKIETNPAHKAAVPKAPEGRCRYLTADELHRVLQACPEWLRPIAGLAVALGTRRGELLAVRWEDINLKADTILLWKTKNGKMRPAFLNDLALEVLGSMGEGRHKGSGLLFPDVTPAQVSVAFIRACEDAGIDDFSFHDLRHCYASQLRMAGADLHDLQKLLGHSDPRMTNVYAHLSNEHLATAARRLDSVYRMPVLTGEVPADAQPKRALPGAR